MPAGLRPLLLRRSDGGELLERFLVSGVVSVLAIRWALAAAGYPRLGSGSLHIAHMLWGGALMVGALIALFLFLGRRVDRVAAVVAGLGFGIFVDEIGKFVTADNDYFYRPALVLIYLVFVSLFLLIRAVTHERSLEPGEQLANALDVLESAAVRPVEARTRATAEALLDRSDPADPLVPALRAWLASRPSAGEGSGPVDRLERLGARIYERVVDDARFALAIGPVALLVAGAAVVGAVALLVVGAGETRTEAGSVSGAGEVVSAVAGAILVGRGVLALPGSRRSAYQWFRRGVLVWILVTQVFVFYISQLAGLAGLALDVVAYAVLTSLLDQELAHPPSASSGPNAPSSEAPDGDEREGVPATPPAELERTEWHP